jgi:hypothetical protein
MSQLHGTKSAAIPRPAQWALAVIALIGLAARLWTLTHLDPAGICFHDFPPLYASAKLLGTPDLYSADAYQRLVRQYAGCANEAQVSSLRPPFVAVGVWPFAQLSLRDAMLAWELASAAALIVFLWFWPAPKIFAAAIACWALPVSGVISFGQDDLFLLLWVAIAAALLSRGRPFTAGMVLALCSAKPHLFLLLPLFLLGRRMWSTIWGLLAGGAMLTAISFAAAGRHWPAEFLRAALDRHVNPHPWSMPNLQGLFYGASFAAPAEFVFSIAVAILVWRTVRIGVSTEYALAATLVGGLLTSHHAYLPDAALLLPAALIIPFEASTRWLRLLAIVAVLPIAYVPWAIPKLTFVPSLLVLLLLAGMALDARGATARKAAE